MGRADIFRTRVARRVFLLFVLGAMAPVIALGGYSLWAVSTELRDQSQERLQQLSKNVGMSVMERLQDADADLRFFAAGGSGSPTGGAEPTGSLLRVFARPADAIPPEAGSGNPLSPADRDHLARGGAVLQVRRSAGGPTLWLVRALPEGSVPAPAPAPDPDSLLWAELDQEYLWTTVRDYVGLPTVSGFCVMLSPARPLYCGAGGSGEDVTEAMVDAFRVSPVQDGRGLFEWEGDGGDYLGASWELFLRTTFRTNAFTILVSESGALVYQNLRRFALFFPPVLLLGLIVVTLLANLQVRRTLEPLEKLAEGTRRIADQDFEARVEVRSQDEFEDLAASFNTMAERLGVQFRHLQASRAIDRAVLSASHRDEVVDALLSGFGGVTPYDRLAVLVLERGGEAGGILHWVDEESGASGRDAVRPTALDLARLRRLGVNASVADEGELASLLRGFPERLLKALVLPLVVKGEVTGAVIVGRKGPFAPEEILRARQIVDQAAVALDEVQLVAALEALSWGTLRALARAIDAKSQWTAGHSERVVRLALAVGREVGLSEKELGVLERGGLLHDLGKIGVPARVLDGEGPIDGEDLEIMRGHVLIGARILEPIAAYADVIPIVRNHHERWDGKGYPDGLAGEQIPLLARVLTVADTFDAMISSRPYRGSLPEAVVLGRMQHQSGTQFDPALMDALRRVIEGGWSHVDADDELAATAARTNDRV